MRPRPAGTAPSRPLRYRNFRYLWLGQISHAGALWMEQLARPVLIWELTGSGAHMGGVVAMRTLPQLFFGVWAGVVSDWFDRRRVLLIDKVGVLILNIIFAALIVTGNLEIWHIYLVSFLRGTMMAFDQPAPAVAHPHRRASNTGHECRRADERDTEHDAHHGRCQRRLRHRRIRR